MALVLEISIFQMLVVYTDFESAKNIHVLQLLIWGFGGRLIFLTGVWNLNLDLDMEGTGVF